MAVYWLAGACVLLAWTTYLLLHSSVTPEERERRRRLRVHAAGRVTDAVITEARVETTPSGAMVHLMSYTYDIRGVSYSASQDISNLLAYLDRDPDRLAGPATAKYLPGNPSNSIVMCEEWSGVR